MIAFLKAVRANPVWHALRRGRARDRGVFGKQAGEASVAAEAIAASYLRNVLDTIPDLVWLKDANGVYLACNASFERFFGAPEAQIVGRTDHDFVAADLADFFREKDRQAMAADKPSVNEEWVSFASDGHRALLETIKTPMRDASGKLIGVLGIARDMTERRKSEEALRVANEFNATIVHSSPAFFVAVGADGRIRMMNEAMLQAVGYSAEEVVGQDYTPMFVPAEERSAVDALFKQLCEQREATLSTNRIFTRSGKPLTVEWRGVPIFEAGRFDYFIGVGIDITERERVEAELSRHRAQLEDLVAERTTELRQALDKLVRTQQSLVQSGKLAALGALVAGVAHELNTPIGNGLTATSTIEEATQQFAARAQVGLKRSDLDNYVSLMVDGSRLARSSLQRAAELVGSFKQVAVDQIGSQRRSFDLQQMLQDTLQTLAPTLRQTPYTLDLDAVDGIQMNSYPGPLGQVVASLFQNALLHGLEGRAQGHMSLRARQRADVALIDFSDDGVGIPGEHLALIFDPFFTTKLGRGSSGLGLHIVHNIVTSVLGGEISVTSVEGTGTAFSMRLPLIAPNPLAPAA